MTGPRSDAAEIFDRYWKAEEELMAKKKATAVARRPVKKKAPKKAVKKKAVKKTSRRRTSLTPTIATADASDAAVAERSALAARPRRTTIARSELPQLPVVGTGGGGLSPLGLSRAKFTSSQRLDLLAPWHESEVSIRPDGVIYVDAAKHRKRLTQVFGPDGWGEDPHEPEPRQDAGLIVQRWALFIGGVPISVCLGECEWQSGNRRMSKGDAVEGAKSNALARNCKGIMNQDYRDKREAYQFRMRYGVLVLYKQGSGWRHIDDPPLDKERGLDPRSPNRASYVCPSAVEHEAGHTRPGVNEAAVEPPPQTQALVPSGEALIPPSAVGQIATAMRTHQRTVAEVRAFLKAELGVSSRKDIRLRDFDKVLTWIRAPYDVDQPSSAIIPEVVE